MSATGGRWGHGCPPHNQNQQKAPGQHNSGVTGSRARDHAGPRQTMQQHGRGDGGRHSRQHTGSKRGNQEPSGPAAVGAMDLLLSTAPPHLAQYLQKWHPLVNAELAAEQAIVNERLATWPLDRLKREGLVLLGLNAVKRGSLYGAPIWVLRQADRGAGQMPYHRFVAGDEVLISRGHPLHGPGRQSTGTVLERGAWELRLVSNDRLPTDGTPLRLDKGVNTVVYERMRAALNSLVKTPTSSSAAAAAGTSHHQPIAAPDTQQQQQQQQGSGNQQRRNGKRQRQQDEPDTSPPGTILADVLVSPTSAAAAGPSSLIPPAAIEWAHTVQQQQQQQQQGTAGSGSGDRQGLAARDADLGLNRSQVAAIANCLLNKLSLIHGPPGTGKTTTTVALLAQLVKRFKLPFPLLAVAQSHVAVDNLLEGLVDAGVSAVRIGQPVKVRDSLRGATLDALRESHPKTREVETAAQELRELRAQLPSLHGRDRGLGHRDVNIMARKVTKMREDLVAEVLKGAQVICATCAAAGSDMLAGATFPVVVLDEASQASEPEALIPLTRGAEHVVLVGDHLQLPPVVNSDAAVGGGMAVSLFERLMQAGVPSAMLQVQYRMHPCLSAFPNDTFYGGRLVDGVTAEQRPAPAHFPWPSQQMPIVFVDVDGREDIASGGSKLNRAEAGLVEQVVLHLLNTSKEPRSAVGVITPYLAQLNLLSQQLSGLVTGPSAAAGGLGGAHGGSSTVGQGSSAADGYEQAAGGGSDVLEMKTVDGYQGREKEVVVFSAVRANRQAQVGFLDDWRRLNVAITRPRRGLILLGNADTLAAGDERWSSYLKWLRQRGCVVTAQAMQQQMAACR